MKRTFLTLLTMAFVAMMNAQNPSENASQNPYDRYYQDLPIEI